MGRYQRRKGHNWEREVARRLRPIFESSHRGVQARDGGEAGDVVVPRFHVECKCGQRDSVDKAMRQAIADAKPGLWPTVIVKRDRQEPTVTMTLEDWTELVRQWWEAVNR